jgi:hypothetical protein
MPGLLKSRYFWIITGLLVFMGIILKKETCLFHFKVKVPFKIIGELSLAQPTMLPVMSF